MSIGQPPNYYVQTLLRNLLYLHSLVDVGQHSNQHVHEQDHNHDQKHGVQQAKQKQRGLVGRSEFFCISEPQEGPGQVPDGIPPAGQEKRGTILNKFTRVHKKWKHKKIFPVKSKYKHGKMFFERLVRGERNGRNWL